MLRPFAHTVACCWMLLRVVAQSLKPVKLFSQQLIPNISFVSLSPKRNATMLDPFAQLSQHCWGRARSLCMVYKDLWVVSFPRCTAGPDIVGNCCVRLHAALKSKFALLQTLSRLFHLVYFVKCWQMLLKLNSKGLYQSSGKEKER